MLAASHAAHAGQLCVGVDWERHPLDLLQAAATALGGRVLGAVCRHLAHDYASFCHGAPDLLLLDTVAPPLRPSPRPPRRRPSARLPLPPRRTPPHMPHRFASAPPAGVLPAPRAARRGQGAR